MPSVEGVKISQLPQANTLDESDVLAGVQTGTTKKFALSTLVAWIKAHLNLTAADVGAVPTSAVGATGGVAGLDASGKVPAAELDLSGVQAEITASGILKGDGAGGVSAAVSETDYATPAMIPSVPSISTSTPNMDGTAAAGSTGDVSDAGHIHPSDTSKANQSQLATVETGTTSSRAYAVGEYFCWNGLLYRVKQAISNAGVPFTVGTNCEQVTVGGFNAVRGRFDLLWTNINTSTAFAGQTIPLDLSDYDAVLIEQLPERQLISSQVSYPCRKSNITNNIQSMYLPAGSTVPTFYQRTVTVSTNGVTFGDGFEKPATATARTTNNHAIHPRAIYGIKF